jgi:hypothetical protein
MFTRVSRAYERSDCHNTQIIRMSDAIVAKHPNAKTRVTLSFCDVGMRSFHICRDGQTGKRIGALAYLRLEVVLEARLCRIRSPIQQER